MSQSGSFGIVALLAPVLCAAVAAYTLTPLMSALARRLGAIDNPGPRKVHDTPTPRLGGVAVVTAILLVTGGLWLVGPATYPLVTPSLHVALLVGSLPVFVVSCYDDIKNARPVVKLSGQLAGATIAVGAGLHLSDTVHVFDEAIPIGWLAMPLSIAWIVGVTNAFNLIDGLDGLSAGLGLISSASLALVAAIAYDPELIVLSLVVSGALAGFIPYNLHPARVFLGDSGANTIGYCLACLTLSGGSELSGGLAVFVPMLAVGVPLADTLVSILRRFLRGLRGHTGFAIFEADCEHIHHRLVRLGFTHRRVVLILYSFGVAAAGVGIASLFVTAPNAGLLVAAFGAASFVAVGRLGYDEFALLRSGVVLKLYDSDVITGRVFRVVTDVGLVAFAFYGAVALKYDDWDMSRHGALFVKGVLLLAPIHVVVFWVFRMYERDWRYASIGDALSVNFTVGVSTVLGLVSTRLLVDAGTSITLFATYTIVLILGTAADRASYRVFTHIRDANRDGGRRVVLYGAGVRGVQALRETRVNASLRLLPVGFIDDDPRLHGSHVDGLPVLGGVNSLGPLIEDEQLDGILLTTDRIPLHRRRMAVQHCSRHGIRLYTFSIGVRQMLPHHVRDLSIQPAAARSA